MASLNNIELKNIVNFKGHELEDLIQANVYYKGKKVGFYSQDSWGGCDNFNLDYDLDKDLKTEIHNITDNYITNYMGKDFKGYEWFFGDLLELMENERIYKKYSKKMGVNTISLIPNENGLSIKVLGRELTDKEKMENKKYYTYTSLNDFNIKK